MRVGLISDTHFPTVATRLHPAIFQVFQGVDLILHAGDLTGPDVIALAGTDRSGDRCTRRSGSWVSTICPSSRCSSWPANGSVWCMATGRAGWNGPASPGTCSLASAGSWRPASTSTCCSDSPARTVDCIVCGHLHRPFIGDVDGMLMINPGSAYINILDRRTQPGQYVSVGMLEINGGSLQASIVPLPERWQELQREWFGECYERESETGA